MENLTLTRVYGAKGFTMDELTAWIDDFGAKIKPFVANTTAFLREAQANGKRILFEAQLGACAIWTTASIPTPPPPTPSPPMRRSARACPPQARRGRGRGQGLPSCVGEGPFTCEWFGDEAAKLREAGAEFGAKTGRPRRVGPIDLVATRYGVEMQGATSIALTKPRRAQLHGQDPLCAHYEIDGVQTDDFPFPVLDRAKPVMEYMPGWQCDISGARRWEDLPEAARSYVEYVERAIGCPIGYVSVGPEREPHSPIRKNGTAAPFHFLSGGQAADFSVQ